MRRVDQELFNAVEQGNLSEIEKCLNRGANVLARDSHHTVLHSAVRSDNGEVVKLVLNKIKETQGPYIDAKDTEGDTPLMWTAETGYVNAAQVLLEYGADVETKNNNGMAALHWAAKNNHIEVMKLLIDKGANINVQDNYGKTPLERAREEGHGEIAGYLVFGVAEVFREQGKYNKAWQTYQEAFDIQEVVLGPNHLDTLRTRHNMARVLSDQGKYSEALNIYQKVLDIQKRREVLGPNHSDTLMTRHNIAVVLREQGKYSEALRILRKVLNIQKAKLGSDHPVTLLTSSSIEIIQKEKMSRASFIHAKDGKTPSDFAREEGHEEIAEILDGSDTGRESPVYTSLHNAAKDGDLEAVEYLISKGADVNDTNEDGWTPLHCAASEGESEVAEFLTEKGANVHAKDNGSKKPIHLAARNGHKNVVEFFLNKGLDVNDPDWHGFTLLHFAAAKGHLEVIKFVLNRKANIHARNIYGNTVSQVAAANGHRGVVEFFLNQEGVNIDDSGWNGFTSLHIAADKGHLEVVQFLLDKGANVHAKDNGGKEPIHVAAAEGHKNVVEFFLSKEVSVDERTKDNWTPLHCAASAGQSQVVKFLIEKGANINAKDIVTGKKPIHSAAKSGHKNVIEFFLISRKINVDNTDNCSATPLQYAIVGNQLEIVKFLVNRGANIHNIIKDGTDEKPIHVAMKCSQEIIEFLLSKGASVDDTNKNRETPLHYAASEGRLEIVKFLIDKGANINAENIYGSKAINLARRKGHSSVEKLLSLHERRVIQSTSFNEEQQEKFLRSISDADVKRVKQGLYLPSFEARNVEIDGKCVAITCGLSQALFLHSNKSFLSNLETSAEIYERIAQGKQISEREEREIFAFSKLLNNFERQLDSATNSLPSSLIHNKGYKTLGDLSNYIAGIKGDFAIHLVTSNHVIAIYRVGDSYAYFDSNAAFVSEIKSVDQLMKVVEKGAGYKVGEKGFLVEHFDVDKANSQLSNEDKKVLAKEIKTERQLLAEQDKEFGLIKINGQEVSRVQLYNFGTKINVEGSVPLLINADMNLNSKSFSDYLSAGKISMTAREYLENLKNSRNVEEEVQATKVIPFIGSKREIEEAEQTRKPKRSLLEQLVKEAINHILAAVFLSRLKSQLPGKAEDKPRTCLNDPTVDNQLQRSL